MQLPKERSRKRQVYEMLIDQGVDAALELGLASLDLKEASVRSWIAAWRKGGLYGGEEAGKGAPLKRERPRKADPLGREQKMYCGRPVTILKEGPEQSEIRYEDGDRMTRIVVNEWLEEVRIRPRNVT